MAKNQFKLVSKSATTPITTVYYGTEEHLQDVIANMSVQHPNLQVVYAVHKADTDDTKEHTHVLIKTTAGKISNTDAIRKYFKHEYDDKYYIMPFYMTKENALYDWFLYVQHDVEYLASKGYERNIHYSEDVVKGNEEFIAFIKASGQMRRTLSELSDLDIINQGIEQGKDNFEILKMLQGVTADNLNAIWQGIERLRNGSKGYDAIYGRCLNDYFHESGIVQALSYHMLALPQSHLKSRKLTADACKRFIDVCVNKALNIDEIAYIFDEKITD